ncbi:hypothetical protein ACFRAQ_36135 [Nocardia sp. NPDC056611]|uniref:hypothetical protein n=1 Tax=Nocardia sp. NPDC056611 TaxID=3345877 RepID=UPI00366BC66E
MPSLDADCRLTYTISHEAWYFTAAAALSGDEQPHLNVHSSAEDGGVAWEFRIREGGLKSIPSTQIVMFDDAYAALTQVPELFAALAAERPRDVAAVIAILDRLGAQDITERTDPVAKATR